MIIHKIPGISQSLFVIPTLVQRHYQVDPKFSPALRRAPETYHNHSHGTCSSHLRSLILMYKASEIPVTPKAGRNALLWSDTLLKLTLLSLHFTSSQTFLEASRVWNTLCWWCAPPPDRLRQLTPELTPHLPWTPPVPAGDNQGAQRSENDNVPPGYVYSASSVLHSQFFNLDGYGTDSKHDKDFILGLLTDGGTSTG